jgi:hypothetical protein
MIHRLVLAILLYIVVSNNVSASEKPEIFAKWGILIWLHLLPFLLTEGIH